VQLPRGIVFDGEYLWVSGTVGGTFGLVAKLRPDGSGATSFVVGQGAFGIAFDGASIWVANSGDGTVSKLRASDGSLQGTFPVGNTPRSVAFDGASIWVANSGDGTVSKLQASDGSLQGTFRVVAGAWGLAFDGASMWVGGQNAVVKLQITDGTILPPRRSRVRPSRSHSMAPASGPFNPAGLRFRNCGRVTARP
jgi:hypothetical protein